MSTVPPKSESVLAGEEFHGPLMQTVRASLQVGEHSRYFVKMVLRVHFLSQPAVPGLLLQDSADLFLQLELSDWVLQMA